MSNRAARRRMERETGRKFKQVEAVNPTDSPMLTCLVEQGNVVLQIAMPGWVNQLTLPVEFAKQFHQEYGDCIREIETGLKVEHVQSQSGLFVPHA